MKVIKLFLIFFCIFAIHFFAEDLVVVADGEASGAGLNAKEKSIENALRNAVEKGFGVYVDSTTIMENAALISDEITTQTKGFVRSYDILEERINEGIYYTKIKAVISMDEIWESDSLSILLNRMGAPRFIIISDEADDSFSFTRCPALQKMTEILVGKGFHLVEVSNSDYLLPLEKSKTINNFQKISLLAEKLNAEIVILLNTSFSFLKKDWLYGKELMFFNGVCEAKALQVDSSKIIASSVGKAVRGSEIENEAIRDALMFASSEASDGLLKGILNSWSKTLNSGHLVQVQIKNISVSQLANLTNFIKSIDGVSNVNQRHYGDRLAQLEVTAKFPAIVLAENIDSIEGMTVEIIQVTTTTIQIKIK